MIKVAGREVARAVLLACTTKDYYRRIKNVVSSIIDASCPASTLGETVNKGAMAIILALMSPSGVAAEPKVLADRELDSITAAGVFLDVSSIVAAMGDVAKTRTDTNTFTMSGDSFDLGLGLTIGQAIACCGDDADVEVGSTVLGIGDHVRGATHVFERDGNDRRRWAYGFSLGFILALSFDEQFVRTRDDQLEMLDQLRAALTGFRMELPDALRGSDLAKDRWSQLAGAR